MAHNLTQTYITQFDTKVFHVFQEKGSKLRNAVTYRGGVEGSTYQFQKYGSGAAMDRGSMSSVVGTMGVTSSKVQVVLSDFVAPEYSDIFQQAKINFDDESQLAKAIAMAMGRKEDQVILEALGNASGVKSIAANMEDGSTAKGLTVTKIRRAKRLLDDQSVPSEDRYMVVTPAAIEELLGATEVTSIDYNTVKTLYNGEVDTFLGFKFIVIADFTDVQSNKLGLPGVGTADRKYFAFQKDALGMAVGIDHRTEINYVAERTSFLVNGIFSAGASAINPEGIVEINVKEVVA